MDLSDLGKMILIMGVALVVLGGLLMLANKWPGSDSGWGWLGRLPGDIYIKRDNFTFYFPITTSILLSVVGSLILYFLFRR
ncbi:MAG: DUF2905 domain-containing protein [Nitrospirae bacterium]|nr:MAG: DUF2905 domain-containing protein [Nitrospirota bacterium]